MAFRQREYNSLRDQVRSDLEEQERLKAEEEQRAAEEAKRAAEAEGNNEELVASQASLGSKKNSGVAEEEKRPNSQDKVSSAHEHLQIEVEAEEDAADPMQTMNSSRRLLSEHMHSVGGTSKSIGRSTKFM